MNAPKPEFRQDIQILRGLAVLFVVLYHLQAPFFQNGYLGVDVFFVISGFLMATLYDRGSVIDFYKRRIHRLFPAYALTIIFTLAAAAFVFIPPDFGALFQQSLYSLFFAGNAYFWSQNSYFSASDLNPLLNLWSLGVEVQFYLIVPFLYPFLRKYPWALAVVIIMGFAACALMQHISPKTAFFMMPFRIWEFLMGAAVAWHFNALNLRHRAVDILRYLLPLCLIGALFTLHIAPNGRDLLWGHPALPALMVCLITAAIMAVGMPTRFEKTLIGKVLARLGDYSYSIYLVHFPVIILMNYQIFGGTNLAFEGSAALVIALYLIIFLSLLSYHLVEQKGRILFSTFSRHFYLLGAVLLASFIFASLNKANITPAEQKIFAALQDRDTYRCGKIFRVLNPMTKICAIGQDGFDDNILLVGDSHADAIKKSFALVANENNRSVFFYVDNDPLVSADLSAAQIIKDAQNLNVQNIVLHFNNKYKKPHFVTKLKALITLAQDNDITLTLIAPVPTYPMIVPKAAYLAQEKSGFEEGFKMNAKAHQEKLSEFFALIPFFKTHGVHIIEPAQTLCPKGEDCHFMDEGGTPLYFDSHHLNLKGAQQLERLFEEIY